MRGDKNDVLLLCEEIAYFLFSILHLLLTRILPLIALLVSSLFLHLFRLSRSLLSSRDWVFSRNHARSQTSRSTYRENDEPLEDGLQDDVDSVEDDWIGVQQDRLVHVTVNEQELEGEPALNLLQGKQGEEREKERSERDSADDSGIATPGLVGGANGAAEAGGQDTQNLDGNGGQQEAEQGDGYSGAWMVAPVKLLNTGELAETGSMKKESHLSGFVQGTVGASRQEDNEEKDDAGDYSPPWLRPQRSLQSPSDLPPDLDGVLVAAAVNNEGRAVAGRRPLAPTFSTVAAQLHPHNERSAASDRPAAIAGESDQTSRQS